MRKFSRFHIEDPIAFPDKFIKWAAKFPEVCILHSNDYRKKLTGPWTRHTYDLIAGIGMLENYGTDEARPLSLLDEFISARRDWIFGHLSYDLKNQIENLKSSHPDHIDWPLLHFFVPRYVFILQGNELKIGWLSQYDNEQGIYDIVEKISDYHFPEPGTINFTEITGVLSRSDYLRAVGDIKEHIKKGNIYEMNFCHEFYSNKAEIDPANTWLKLLVESPTPFSCFYRLNNKYLLCASPERFIKKNGNKIISQPIKGTSPRGKTSKEDTAAMRSLATDPKERAENIMITDLVRNDLSRIACRGTVRVNELCGVYPYPHVLQMQSDISANLTPGINFSRVISATFPMGSMTGAPKIRAMELIEMYEKSRRGLYSGSVGYISPNMDFDFNVVIRSLQYNSTASYLSYMVGSAITCQSIPEKEYTECLLKARAIMKVLGQIPG